LTYTSTVHYPLTLLFGHCECEMSDDVHVHSELVHLDNGSPT
jgi:hypothetical protein